MHVASRTGRKRALPVALALLAGSGVLTIRSGPAYAASSPTRSYIGSRPNIVLIVTDDQRYDELQGMPFLRRAVTGKGLRFKRAFVSNPLCCPSRASILTGQYSHSNGIYLNGDGHWPGGFDDFRDSSTIATWLRAGGYRTALVGKYLNHYDKGSYVPPGWSSWRAQLGSNASYYNYSMSFGGRIKRFGSKASDYATDVEARLASRFIRKTPRRKRLFLYFAPPAPHGPRTPPSRYLSLPTHPMPTYPSFNERHIRDKPRYLRRLRRLRADDVRFQRHAWARAEQTLRAVDDAIARIIRALGDEGRLHNTLIVFISDNGTGVGEHRWTFKMDPHEESIRVPLLMRWPGHIHPGRTTTKLAGNIDLAPTLAAVAGVRAPGVDGVSLVPVLRSDHAVRGSLLLEHQYSNRRHDPPTYCGIRTSRWKLVVYKSGEREFYDLRKDPYELSNKARTRSLAAVRHRLTERLRRLCVPRPPGMPSF